MKKQHTHKYIRSKFKQSGTRIYKCILPGCHHYILEEFIEGKISVCWYCGEDFVIGKRAKRLKKPHCDCVRRANRARNDIVEDFVGSLLK